ncbi:MAG: hypothetical protein ACI9J3_000214 [Parvicellaceae bacterium]|jgi:hypothetical protein
MKNNMGTTDRVVRVLIALAIFFLYGADIISGIFSGVFMLVALMFLITSAIGTCPIYTMLGLKTKTK